MNQGQPKVYRPWPLQLVNQLGKLMPFSGQLRADRLIKAAKNETGLSKFNDESFIEPLEKLIESIKHEARLNAIGQLITKIRLKNVLVNRLRIEKYIEQHPELLEEEVDPIILVSGLQRTGTTKLHRLLASDPNTRFLSSWEALNPVPLRKADNSDRIKAAKTSEKALRYMAPKFFAIHPVEYNSPEEEVLLLDMSLLSTVPEATMHVPGFAAWVEKQDQTTAYEYMKRVILVLQHQYRKKKWVMKSPHHLEFLDVFCKVFPETYIIQTHRHPKETLASFCSMVFHSRAIFSDEVSAAEIGRHWSRKASNMLKNAMKYRKAIRDKNFADIYYADLISDAGAEIKKVYDFFGLDFSELFHKAIKTTEVTNRQNKHGKHQYRLEDFDLTEERINELFSEYLNCFQPDRNHYATEKI